MNTDKSRGHWIRFSSVLIGVHLWLICLCSGGAARAEQHEFVFDASSLNPKPKSVHVAGSFNNWSKTATTMTRDGRGVWHAKVDLPQGTHYYKFVIDGDRWLPDPKADKDLEQDDNYGGKNSGIVIGPNIKKAPPPKPDAIDGDFVQHDPNDSTDTDNLGDGRLRLRLRAQADDVQTVKVSIENQAAALSKLGTEGGFDLFGGVVGESGGDPNPKYWFELKDGRDSAILDKNGFFDGMAAINEAASRKDIALVAPPARIHTPDWAKHAVWYQIFPERFRNGDPSNDPGDKPYEHLVRWQSDWWKTQPGEPPGEQNFYKGKGNVWKRRYGGDVQGLIDELPYLRNLGINAIYLNPMFEADSMHKYDATDYRHIDDNFGTKGDVAKAWQTETDDPSTWTWTPTDKLFLKFVDEAHKQGFKVILDGVFNHVGRSHWAFQDVLKNGKNSKYADWFDVRDWTPPIKYIAWDKGNEPTSDGALPVFKKNPRTGMSDGPRKHIFAITKRWLAPDGDPSKGVDGWRLDVPGDIPHPFWIEWRKLVKSTKPDAYIAGEIWDWAQPWLNNGDQFDAVMNYRFAIAAQEFFVNQKRALTPTQFSSRLNELIYAYPLQVSLVQMNLFDSHDTDRLASMFMNPDLNYDASNRIQDNGPNYSPAKPDATARAKQKLAVACQMTFVGAPMTYYGDEAGMWSPDDPSNRQPMVWKDLEPYDDAQVKFDQDIFDFYRRAIAIRHHFPELQLGMFRPLVTDDSHDVIAYARDLDGKAVYIAINKSDQEQTVRLKVDDPDRDATLVDYLDPRQAQVNGREDATRLSSSKSSGRAEVSAVEKPDAPRASSGTLSLKLKPLSAAILAQPR